MPQVGARLRIHAGTEGRVLQGYLIDGEKAEAEAQFSF